MTDWIWGSFLARNALNDASCWSVTTSILLMISLQLCRMRCFCCLFRQAEHMLSELKSKEFDCRWRLHRLHTACTHWCRTLDSAVSNPNPHPSQWTALAGRPATRRLQTVHDGVQVSARFGAAVPCRTLRTCRGCTRLSSSLLCFSWSSGLPSLQFAKLWLTCIFACQPLLLELSSL